MKAYICDREGCGRQHEPKPGFDSSAPEGWYSVSVLMPGRFDTKHLCSPECLNEYSNAEIRRTMPAAEPPPAPYEPEVAAAENEGMI